MPDRPDLPPWLWPRAAYIHVPFCAHRCGYCDFAVTAGQDHLIDLYVDALGLELARLETPAPARTIFLGGGTPTYLPPRSLADLLSHVTTWLPLPPGGEFSIEATPESLTPERVEILVGHGVNRVSLGVQSFQADLLRQLDRIHSPEQVAPAVECLRAHGLAYSLDLIFGIPGQSVADWRTDLETALRFAPDHISTYGLTYEKGTQLWKQRQRGQVQPVPEGDELAMYLLAQERLADAGFEAYEVSNFARPGRRCRHNETYWANEAYWGFGVGAARFVMGSRELNRRNTADYVRRVLAGEDPTFQRERLAPEDAARETAAVQFRRTEGIIREPFRTQTGYDFDTLTGGRAAVYVAEGLLEDTGTAVRLTPRGRCVADGLLVRVVWG